MYTSGTTGNPKGVMLSHDNILYTTTMFNKEQAIYSLNEAEMQPEDIRVVSYLPLSHIAGFMCDLGHLIVSGGQVYFAKPDALQGTLIETLQWCRPNLFLAVPRIYEKFEDKLKEVAASKPKIAQ